jgi:cytochrome c oxidase cbb3-type subunit 4
MEEIIQFARSIWGLWLMLIFLGIVAWTFWPGRKTQHEQHAQIPLRNDD